MKEANALNFLNFLLASLRRRVSIKHHIAPVQPLKE
jgi:hypothetical protein